MLKRRLCNSWWLQYRVRQLLAGVHIGKQLTYTGELVKSSRLSVHSFVSNLKLNSVSECQQTCYRRQRCLSEDREAVSLELRQCRSKLSCWTSNAIQPTIAPHINFIVSVLSIVGFEPEFSVSCHIRFCCCKIITTFRISRWCRILQSRVNYCAEVISWWAFACFSY
jgi:hypothetical protein